MRAFNTPTVTPVASCPKYLHAVPDVECVYVTRCGECSRASLVAACTDPTILCQPGSNTQNFQYRSSTKIHVLSGAFSKSFREAPLSTKLPHMGPVTAQATPWHKAIRPSMGGRKPISCSMARNDDGSSCKSAPFNAESRISAANVPSLEILGGTALNPESCPSSPYEALPRSAPSL